MPIQTTLPTATPGEILGFLNEVALPNIAKGVLIRRPGALGMIERLELEHRAVRRLQKMRARHGAGPVFIPMPGRPQAVILAREHVHYVLDNSPEPFATAETLKKTALRHFEPEVALISHGRRRTERRALNEKMLETPRRVHSLAERFLPAVEEEADTLREHVRRTGELSWDAFIEAWYRAVRRVVLGDSARDDHRLTRMLGDLRANANWAFMRPTDTATRERFLERLHEWLARAEPGSLASFMTQLPRERATEAGKQFPQYLFAFDPAGMAMFRTLALLSTHPEQARDVQEETDTADGPERPFLNACILESLRLWPTTPAILRETTVDTQWENGTMPAGTSVLIFAPYFHRDDESLPYAHRFAPQIWLDERGERDWPLVPFSGGPAACPARNLVLLLSSTMLSRLLDGMMLRQRPPTRLLKSQPLPTQLNHFTMRFELQPQGAQSYPMQPATSSTHVKTAGRA